MEDISSGLDLTINGYALFAGFLFSVIGWWVYREGKRHQNTPVLAIGVLLMIYPYFVYKTASIWAIGLLLCGAARYFW